MTVKIIESMPNGVAAPDGTRCPAWVVECTRCGDRILYGLAHWDGQPVKYVCEACGYVDVFDPQQGGDD